MSPIAFPSNVLSEVTCPSCWAVFAPDAIKWVAEHPDLIGDVKLGAQSPVRFTPTRFDAAGLAIDRNETKCLQIACPNCHRIVPRALVETPPWFVLIAGSPSSGKTSFLNSMVWQMRQSLPANFKVAMTDANSSCNRFLNDSLEQSFFSADRNALVRFPKTEDQGDLYHEVHFDGELVQFPKPFLFSIRPMQGHPLFGEMTTASRLMCLYDNTGQLEKAAALWFCFDPTQDPRMRSALAGKSEAPQVAEEIVTTRQEIVFIELADRFKQLTQTAATATTNRPVVIVVTKFDVWQSLYNDCKGTPNERLKQPVRFHLDESASAMDGERIDEVSQQTRTLLLRYAPELISSVESFSSDVTYTPVSATGCSPRRDPSSGILGIPPAEISPTWCDVPLLCTLAKHSPGLIPIH